MHSAQVKSRLEQLIAMAQLLERVDADPLLVGAAQYRLLARSVQGLLAGDLPDDALRTVLRACPASAVLYENLHYDRSGLSQSPLDKAVDSELLASEVIGRARRTTTASPPA
jgi:hypothetical protein